MPLRAFVQPPPPVLLGEMFYGSSSRKHGNHFKTPIKTESVFPPISVPAPVKPGNNNGQYSVNIVESEHFSEIVNVDQDVEKSAQSIGDSGGDQETNSGSVPHDLGPPGSFAHNLGHPDSFSRDLSKPRSSTQDLRMPGHSTQAVQNFNNPTQTVTNFSSTDNSAQNPGKPGCSPVKPCPKSSEMHCVQELSQRSSWGHRKG